MIIILLSLSAENGTIFMKFERSVSDDQMLKGHESDLDVLQY